MGKCIGGVKAGVLSQKPERLPKMKPLTVVSAAVKSGKM